MTSEFKLTKEKVSDYEKYFIKLLYHSYLYNEFIII